MRSSMSPPAPPAPFQVRLAPPDLSPWLDGNTGVRGFTSYAAAAPGPHVALIALTHGNEFAGAWVLDGLLRAALRPLRGRLTYGFVNLTAFACFDERRPTASRFVDEDMNRVWDPKLLDGPRRSVELDRAREIRRLLDEVDVLLDLHSMLWPSVPLILSGPTRKGRALARAIGAPELIVADRGHASGPRLIDYAPFTDPETSRTAVLVEAGQHWEPETVAVTRGAVAGLLRATGITADHPALPEAPPPRPPRYAEVTDAVTASTTGFAFLQSFRGGDVIPRRDTLIALDGTAEIRTPYDDCLLVMPSLQPSRGHTAVRLARFVD